MKTSNEVFCGCMRRSLYAPTPQKELLFRLVLVTLNGKILKSGELFILIEVRKLFGVLRMTVYGQKIFGVCLGGALSDMCFALVLGHVKFLTCSCENAEIDLVPRTVFERIQVTCRCRDAELQK